MTEGSSHCPTTERMMETTFLRPPPAASGAATQHPPSPRTLCEVLVIPIAVVTSTEITPVNAEGSAS